MKHFGSGSKFCLGEENLFLQDALKKQQKIYFVDQKIGEVNHKTSTWFQGYTSDFFYAEGAVFYAISKKFYKLLILQHMIRKRKLYKGKLKFKQIFKLMLKGANDYEKYEISTRLH